MTDKLMSDFLLDMRNVLLNSAAINDFCLEKYNKSLKVFLGADERDLPEINNCPYVLLDRGKVKLSANNKLRQIEGDFYIFLCIYQDNIHNDGSGVIYTGVLEIETLAQLVRQEIASTVVGPIEFVAEELPSVSEDAPIRQYPVYCLLEKGIVKLKEKAKT